MSEDNPLQRAHALSAHASTLLRPGIIEYSSSNLDQALEAYREAAELFDIAAEEETGDQAAKKTLQMLTTQNRKFARDVERKISQQQQQQLQQLQLQQQQLAQIKTSHPRSSSTSTPPRSRSTSASSVGTVTSTGTATPGGVGAGVGTGSGAVAGGAGGRGDVPAPSSGSRRASNLSSVPTVDQSSSGWSQGLSSSSRPIPPFALRPPSTTPSSSPAPSSNAHLHSPPRVPSVPTLPTTTSPSSPLYSSTSSSEPADAEESYVISGGAPDLLDPFSRFWGMLENKLDDISNAVKFASAPLDVPPSATVSDALRRAQRGSGRDRERDKKGKEKVREVEEGRGGRGLKARSPSPSESFYVITNGDRPGSDAQTSSPSGKTPEELALENESLRASLDALAKHAHALEGANRSLTERFDERDKLVRSVVSGVRKEAKKAKQGQELMRSQMMASTTSASSLSGSALRRPVHFPAASSAGSGDHPDGETTTLRRRVAELEMENKQLKGENETQRTQLDKFTERWNKLKAKKDAKRDATRPSGSSAPSSGIGLPPTAP